MPILRSASGLVRPMATRGGAPLLNSPSSVAAPAIVQPASELLFAMTTARPGVPGVNDQFDNFNEARDWPSNHTHPDEGFAAIRWQPTWKRVDGFYGSWEPAQADIYRIQRKGATGQDAQTLVFTCGPNTATIPVGDPVVIWDVDGDAGVLKNGSHDLSGYALPTRTKMSVTACTPSAAYSSTGRRIIEVNAGQALPAIDFSPTWYAGQFVQKSSMQLRHWRFYKDTATKAMRHPLGWFADLSKSYSIANGGYIMLGGLQSQPTYSDWSRDYLNFGASLVEELWRLECEGLANYLGNTDPRRLAVELENEVTHVWNDANGVPGYRTLLSDVWYPIARTAWGSERTLVVKPTQWGSLNSLRSEFDWPCPTGHNVHLVIHNYDGQIDWPNGKINFGNITQTDWVANELKTRITELGFKGGGITEVGAAPYEFWDQNLAVSEAERGRRLGRMLTSMTNKGLYMFAWGNTGDHYDCVGVRDVGGKQIEAYLATMSPYARRAGLTIA